LQSEIPERMPLVMFSLNDRDMQQFSMLNPTSQTLEPARSRLIDALRRSNRTHGTELKTVLVSDDEPAVLELLAATLVWKGFCVLRAGDGKIGLEAARGHQPDAIILDLAMPGFGGAQMVEQLRGDARTKGIPILIHTGIGLDEPERRRLASQVQAITFKNEQETLFAELERLDPPAQESFEMEASV